MSLPTDELLERLAVWQRLGLVSAEQADAIAAHERGDHGPPGGRSEQRSPRDRTTAAEAIGYVGAALVLGAIGLFVGEYWDGLTDGGQLALATLITVVLAGAAATLRSATSPAISRLTSVLLAGVVAGIAWCTVILTSGMLSWSAEDVGLAVGSSTVVVATPLYLTRRRALPQLTLLAAVLTLLAALIARADTGFETFWFALPYVAVGVVWVLLAEGGYLAPRRVGATVGGILALLALQVASFGDLRVVALVLALAAAASLVAAAVTLGGLHHLGVGAVGLFVFVPQLVFELFGDAIGAPATLLLVGIVLVLLAVGLGRARREVAPSGGIA